ncbi:MAG TPA: DUF488 domain-containing protein [Chloroflexia bacterium]|jgi:uncharacterized protein (DUF488 family)|nr:DUF488 domain-containing protein [Chloroflexia bacterium]
MSYPILTIGHSNQSLEEFLRLLRLHQVDVLVDVRSHPFSKYTVHFNAPALKDSVTAAGIKYLYLGKELGGRPEELDYYDAEGHVLYGRVAEAAWFLDGIARLEKGRRQYRVAVMCSEENPAGCHRRLLVGRVLAARGTPVQHIRGDGRLQTEAELEHEEAGPDTGAIQPSLFDTAEVTVWRSIRSVLRKGTPPTSSEP